MESNNKKNKSVGLITICICAGLVFISFIIYFSVFSSDFLSIDDPVYVSSNPYVTKGITLEGISWALDFGHETGPYWMPLTMLSHMADCHLFGLNPSMHHFTSLLFHCINAVLIFLFFLKVTGERWKSAFIAALFAFHPMNVESVAWISSRKNVLNTFFWFLTLFLYVRYLEKKDLSAYLLVLLSFLAGFMTKATIITLPFSLLLLDIWPLYRFVYTKDGDEKISLAVLDKKNSQPLIEKIPFFILTGMLLYLNFSADNFASEATGLDGVSLSLRLSNALVAYFIYLIKLIAPFNLSVFYPYPSSIPLWKIVLSFSLFILISGWSFFSIKRYPWFFTGWFWFAGNLVVASGIIQGGCWPAYADRFVYIPQLGFFILLVWGFSHSISRFKLKHQRQIFTIPALIFLLFLSLLTVKQVKYWKNGVDLYSHALSVNPRDVVSMVNLAFALDKADERDEAIKHYKKIVRLYPDYWEAHSNLGVIFSDKGDIDKAFNYFKKAIEIQPDCEKALFNIGLIYELKKRDDKALDCFKRVADLNKTNFEAFLKAGLIYEKEKKFDQAVKYLGRALSLKPDNELVQKRFEAVSHADDLVKTALEKISDQLKEIPDDPVLLSKAGSIYRILGMNKLAEDYFQKTILNDPLNSKALSGFAEIYIQKKEYDKAADLYKKLLKEKSKFNLSLYYNLACVYSMKNEIAESLRWLKKAVDSGFDYPEIILAEKQFENIRETDYFKQIEKHSKQQKK